RRANSASRITPRVSNRRCCGRPLLRTLLHPARSAPCPARCALLCAALGRENTIPSLVIATRCHLRLVGAHCCRRLNLGLARAVWPTRAIGDGTLFARAFRPERQDFRLGSNVEDLS